MDRILLSLDSMDPGLGAGLYALNLAKRIQAQVYVLRVGRQPEHQDNADPGVTDAREQGNPVELLINQARREGLNVSYYLADGPFENETVQLIQEKGITILVVEPPTKGGDAAMRDFRNVLDNIRLRVDCHIEVVNQRERTATMEGD